MIGLFVISHGKMAAGTLDSLALIGGEPENAAYASLKAGQDFEVFKTEVVEKITALDQGQGVLVFVDLYGASPYNASMLPAQMLREKGIDIRVISGFNLPMLLETSAMRYTEMTLADLATLAVTTGREAIQDPLADLANIATEEDDY